MTLTRFSSVVENAFQMVLTAVSDVVEGSQGGVTGGVAQADGQGPPVTTTGVAGGTSIWAKQALLSATIALYPTRKKPIMTAAIEPMPNRKPDNFCSSVFFMAVLTLSACRLCFQAAISMRGRFPRLRPPA